MHPISIHRLQRTTLPVPPPIPTGMCVVPFGYWRPEAVNELVFRGLLREMERVVTAISEHYTIDVPTDNAVVWRNVNLAHDEVRYISDLDPFTVATPIPVRVIKEADGVYVASFDEANLHMTGDDAGDAVSNLKDLIAGFIETYRNDVRMTNILDVLRRYIPLC